MRAVLLVGDEGMTEEDLEAACEGLDAATIERAVDSLLTTGLLERIEARLHPGGPAKHFNRLRPL